MNATTTLKMRAALPLVGVSALLALVARTAFAAPASSPGAVATRLGSQDPRDTAHARGLVRPVRPDGAALRAVYDDLAARAAASRQAARNGRSEITSNGAGFSWRDAGIGGAITLLAVVVAGLALTATSRRWKNPARA